MIADYLRRIGGSAESWRPTAANPGEVLQAIARAHHENVPFENLAIHAGEPATADPRTIVPKLVERRRGGICYELNGGLGWLLEQLGWQVAYHGGRVLTPLGPGLPLGHLALVVGVPSAGSGRGVAGRWLVDVGFGGDMIVGPLEQTAPELLSNRDEVNVRQPSGEPVNYLLETRSRPLSDFAGMAWWHSTSPAARFTGSLICSITRDGVRYTLSGRRLKTTRLSALDAPGDDLELATEREVLDCYRDVFGIELEAEPKPRRFAD